MVVKVVVEVAVAVVFEVIVTVGVVFLVLLVVMMMTEMNFIFSVKGGGTGSDSNFGVVTSSSNADGVDSFWTHNCQFPTQPPPLVRCLRKHKGWEY